MGLQATGTILDAVGQILKSAAATITQSIKRAIAKQAAEGFRICALMAWEIFTFPVLKKIVVGHITPRSRGILRVAGA